MDPNPSRKDNSPEFLARVERRRLNRMQSVDRLAPEMRKVVHDYGLNVVQAFIDNGIVRPNIIRHLVETVLDEFSPTRGTSSSQGNKARRETYDVKL